MKRGDRRPYNSRMAIDSIQSLTLLVSDQASALSFYTDVLGLEVKSDRPFGDARWIEVWVGDGTSIILHLPFEATSVAAAPELRLG